MTKEEREKEIKEKGKQIDDFLNSKKGQYICFGFIVMGILGLVITVMWQ